jgi:hypothetical protein
MRLEVCRPADKQAKIGDIYHNPLLHTEGINQFYAQVAMHFLGITRAETTQFLGKQGDAQLGRSYQKRINQPVLAKCCNEHWSADCIDLAKYVLHHYRYILTVLDIFSGKVWLRKITHPLTTQKVADAFETICIAAGTYPHVVQTDNSPAEFLGNFTLWIRNHNIAHPNEFIKHVYSNAQNPQANGAVENKNAQVRSKLRQFMRISNSHAWTAPAILPQIETNLNNQWNHITKSTANQLWSPGYDPPLAWQRNIEFTTRKTDNDNQQAKRVVVQANIVKDALREMKHGRQPHNFEVGDLCRVLLAAFVAPTWLVTAACIRRHRGPYARATRIACSRLGQHR